MTSFQLAYQRCRQRLEQEQELSCALCGDDVSTCGCDSEPIADSETAPIRALLPAECERY